MKFPVLRAYCGGIECLTTYGIGIAGVDAGCATTELAEWVL